MARQSPVESKSPSSAELAKPLPPIKPVGIIILPAQYRKPEQDDEDSPPSSNSDSQLHPSSSLPDLPNPGAEHTLDRRATTSSVSLNVKFAPLPQLAPRKRRSSAPMGIASRAAIMRRRRAGMPGFDMNGDPLPPPPPMWTQEEVDRHTQRILAERGVRSSPREDFDDPFVSLGKMVKGVWRKMNHKKPGEGGEKGGEEKENTGGLVVAERLVDITPTSGDEDTPTQEEGGVWEEEVGDHFPLNVGQTDTIVEGQFSWSAAHLKPPLEDTGSVSDDASGKEQTLSSAEGTEDESAPESHHSGS
ncbi:hypothetical protein DFH06DRAFT_1159129 [Mycena polygramma]|nr:hypothetical protein DFH06DRAFT_1159129 [Mycena polygramma]